jgi:hypothetical protein
MPFTTLPTSAYSTLDATKLSGNLPALNANSLTNLDAADLTGNLPAISGASLTGLSGIDGDADAWARVTPVTDQNSPAVIDFNTSIHNGSNISESGGRITVGTAGWYLITFQVSNQSAHSDTMHVWLRKNTVRQLGSMYWEGNTEINYLGMTVVVLCEASANDIFDVYGSGYWTGNTNNQSQTFFSGVRLGA